MANITVLGAGGFGISLAVMLNNNGHKVNLWAPEGFGLEELVVERESKKLLPGILIPQEVQLTTDIACTKEQDIVIIATPSFAVRATCQRLKGILAEKTVIACVSKGLEEGTHKDLSCVMTDELPNNHNVIISGPSHAEEVGQGQPTTVVAASYSRQAAEYVQDTMMNPTLRIYVSDDVIGVELGAALKNVIALAAGIADGLGLGDNGKAALMTRGITEIARLGVALGGNKETFAGLSGIGDLIVTCTSMHSRNRRAGILIGKGRTAQEAVAEIGMTVEGYTSTKVAYELAQKMHVEMPILEQAYAVLYQNKSPKQGLRDLMGRPKRHESEVIWLLSK